MSKALSASYHWSDATQRYMRCVAEYHCPYGGAHTNPVGMAKAGGAELSTNGHKQVLIVSPLVDGRYSIGTPNWVQVYDEDGNRAPRGESERWRARLAKAQEEAKEAIESAPKGADAPQPISVPTGMKPFELAAESADPGVLAMLAGSSDPAIRLVVIRNPATATGTLEQLVLSEDQGWKVYRLAAVEELSARYQDERDAAELVACERMLADPQWKHLVDGAPAAAVIATTPQQVWRRKPERARRSLIRRAVDQLAKMLGRSVRVGAWTRNRVLTSIVGKDGMRMLQLPNRIAKDLHIRQITGWMLDFFGSLEGDAKAQARVRRKLARSFGFA